MNRLRPRITDAQARSLGALSRVQARRSEDMRQAEAMLAELERDSAEYERRMQLDRHVGKWLARIAVAPVSALAIGMLFVVLYGLWGGYVPNESRYSDRGVYRSVDPALYWIAVVYHSAIAGLLCCLSACLVKASGWFRIRAARRCEAHEPPHPRQSTQDVQARASSPAGPVAVAHVPGE
jgi:hypothetical protein